MNIGTREGFFTEVLPFWGEEGLKTYRDALWDCMYTICEGRGIQSAVSAVPRYLCTVGESSQQGAQSARRLQLLIDFCLRVF